MCSFPEKNDVSSLPIIIIIISLFKVDKHTKIDVNLEHREHLATTQNKKKSIVLIKVN